MSRKKRHNGPCSYCGEVCDLTREHVVPSALFGPQKPSNPVIIWACETCQIEKSRFDADLRDFLAADAWGSQSPTANHILDTKVMRSFQKGRSRLLKGVSEKAKLEPLYSSGGVLLGEFYQFPIEGEAISQALKFIVRGLFYKVKNKRLNSEYRFEVLRYFPDAWKDLESAQAKLSFGEWRRIGEVFATKYTFVAEHPDLGVWILCFYNRVLFTVTVDDPEQTGGRLLANRQE